MNIPSLTAPEMVQQLNRNVVGQSDAKKAISVALRQRWRRLQLPEDVRKSIYPKNILISGPTGVGKTEIARQLSKIHLSPMVKVDATKYTQTGYVGQDINSMIHGLVPEAMRIVSQNPVDTKQMAMKNAKEIIIDAILDQLPTPISKSEIDRNLRAGKYKSLPVEIFGIDPKNKSADPKLLKVTVDESANILFNTALSTLNKQYSPEARAINLIENHGLVFIDEIDKLISKDSNNPLAVGTQRELLTLVEGSTVSTSIGPVNTDHILFIASGAFHNCSPQDLLPELQGRFPIRVEMETLSPSDFEKILSSTENNLTWQYITLMETEGLTVEFSPDTISLIARYAHDFNSKIENIGARRLHSVMEKIFEDIAYDPHSFPNNHIVIDSNMINKKLLPFTTNEDLSKFVL